MISEAKEMEAAEEENEPRFRSDEDSINFRPSPNFKHMKKYLKVHKLEEAMMNEANSSSSEENTGLLVHSKLEKVNNNTMASNSAQPPLPPNPPPPDTPPMIVNVKQEIDDDYICGTTEASPGLEHSDRLKTTTATIKVDHSQEKPGATMCRNFARGTCKKGAACIFAHELILSQLPGVYTFCRNYQNSVCSFPKCKFVHATVFEKEHFFRTGYLPPHAVGHLKEASVQAQAPPPPPQSEEATAGLPPVYSSAAPTPSLSWLPPTLGQYSEESGAEQSGPNIFNPIQSVPLATSPKRAWSEINEVNSATGVIDSGETLAKKCKNCDSNELREQLMKAKIENCARANKERAQKIALLKEIKSRRDALISVLVSPEGSILTRDLELSSLNNNADWTLLGDIVLRKVESMMRPDAS